MLHKYFFLYILHNNKNKFVKKKIFIYSRQSCDWPHEQRRTRSSTGNKSASKSISFFTEVIFKCIFTDVHMRNNYRPNRALGNKNKLVCKLVLKFCSELF